MVVRQNEARISTERRESGETVERGEDRVPMGQVTHPGPPEEPFTNIGLSIARSFRLREYETVRVEVSLHVPCRREDIDAAADAVEAWVFDRFTTTARNLGLVKDAPGEDQVSG